MTDRVLRGSPSVTVERWVPQRHGTVYDRFSGRATEVTVDGQWLTIDAADVDGVRFVLTIECPIEGISPR